MALDKGSGVVHVLFFYETAGQIRATREECGPPRRRSPSVSALRATTELSKRPWRGRWVFVPSTDVSGLAVYANQRRWCGLVAGMRLGLCYTELW